MARFTHLSNEQIAEEINSYIQHFSSTSFAAYEPTCKFQGTTPNNAIVHILSITAAECSFTAIIAFDANRASYTA